MQPLAFVQTVDADVPLVSRVHGAIDLHHYNRQRAQNLRRGIPVDILPPFRAQMGPPMPIPA
jgi:hypothetical protein